MFRSFKEKLKSFRKKAKLELQDDDEAKETKVSKSVQQPGPHPKSQPAVSDKIKDKKITDESIIMQGEEEWSLFIFEHHPDHLKNGTQRKNPQILCL